MEDTKVIREEFAGEQYHLTRFMQVTQRLHEVMVVVGEQLDPGTWIDPPTMPPAARAGTKLTRTYQDKMRL